MQRDLAIFHEVGPQVRSAKKRMLADAKGKYSSYLESGVTAEQFKDKEITETEEQPPISSLGSLNDNGKSFCLATSNPAGC